MFSVFGGDDTDDGVVVRVSGPQGTAYTGQYFVGDGGAEYFFGTLGSGPQVHKLPVAKNSAYVEASSQRPKDGARRPEDIPYTDPIKVSLITRSPQDSKLRAVLLVDGKVADYSSAPTGVELRYDPPCLTAADGVSPAEGTDAKPC